jgi:cytochrome c-type biogenesis protein CcmF
MGIVLMFVGWTGTAFDKNITVDTKVGESFSIGSYRMKVADINKGDNPNYSWESAILQVTKNGSDLGTLEPERRFYKASQQPLGHVALRQRLNEDLYINFASIQGDKAVLQAYVFPLVSWIWIGALVLVFGTLVALVPSKVARQYPRTEVVGIAARTVPVEK